MSKITEPNFHEWAEKLIGGYDATGRTVMKPLYVAVALKQAYDQGRALGKREGENHEPGYRGAF